MKFFQLAAQWPTHVKHFPVGIFGYTKPVWPRPPSTPPPPDSPLHLLQRIRGKANGPPAVIVFLWKSYWLTQPRVQTHKFHVVNWMFFVFFLMLMLGVVVVFLHTTKKEQVLFCKICATASEVFWGLFDNLPHFDNGSCVCTLFLLTFYYFCEILHLLLLYRQWRSVMVMCSGVCEIVWDRVCVCCWKLEYCCESRWNPSLLTQCSVFLLVPLLFSKRSIFIERNGKFCLPRCF